MFPMTDMFCEAKYQEDWANVSDYHQFNLKLIEKRLTQKRNEVLHLPVNTEQHMGTALDKIKAQVELLDNQTSS